MAFSKRIVEVIGVPSDFGANTLGANMGPSEVRNAKLHEKLKELAFSVIDDGDLSIPLRHTLSDSDVHEKYLTTIAELCSQVAVKTHESLSHRRIPVTIGGDHSIAIGSVSGVSKWFKEHKKKLGLIWFDAHADMNTPETSPSGNIHGMPLSVLLGEGYKQLTSIGYSGAKLDPKLTALIGVRSIDEKEKDLCRKMGVRIYTMRDIDERGMKNVMDELITKMLSLCDGVHISFDLDCVDPQHAPGVSTPVPGGLSYREAHLALEMLADTHKLASMDLVELNPLADHEQKTANLGVEFIQSLLGKNIL